MVWPAKSSKHQRRIEKLESAFTSSLGRQSYTCAQFIALFEELMDPKTKIGRVQQKEFLNDQVFKNMEQHLTEYLSSIDLAEDRLYQSLKLKPPGKVPAAKPIYNKTQLVGHSKGTSTEPMFEQVWHLKEATKIVKAELQTDKGKQALLDVLEEIRMGQVPEDENLAAPEASNTPFAQDKSEMVQQTSSMIYGKGQSIMSSTAASTNFQHRSPDQSRYSHSGAGIIDNTKSRPFEEHSPTKNQDLKYGSQPPVKPSVLSESTQSLSELNLSQSIHESHFKSRVSPGSTLHNSVIQGNDYKPEYTPKNEPSTADQTAASQSHSSFVKNKDEEKLKLGKTNAQAISEVGMARTSKTSDMFGDDITGTLTTNGTPKQIPPTRLKLLKNPFLITDPNFPAYRIEKVCFLEKSGKTVVLGRTNPDTITVHIFKNTKDLDSSFDLAGKDIQPVGMECFELVKEVNQGSKDEDITSDKYLDLQILYYFKETHKGKDRVTFQYILPTAKKFKPIICSNVVLGSQN